MLPTPRRSFLALALGLLVAITAISGPSAGAPSPIDPARSLPKIPGLPEIRGLPEIPRLAEIPDPTPAYAQFWKLAHAAGIDRATATGGLPLLDSKGEVRLYGNGYAALVMHSPDVRCERAIAFAAPDPESRSGEFAIEITCETSDADLAGAADAPKCQPKVQASAWGSSPGHVKIKGRCGTFGPSAQCDFYLPSLSGPNNCSKTGSSGGGNNINCKLKLKKAQYFSMTGWGCIDLI